MKRKTGKPHRPFRAFTLVELLTVIGIIAVLVAILLAVLAYGRKQAQETTCLSNLKQLGMALRMYRDDNDAWPSGFYLETAPGEAPREALAPYVKNEQIKRCPIAPPPTPEMKYSYIYQGGILQNKVILPEQNYHGAEGLMTLAYCSEHCNHRSIPAEREGVLIGVKTDGSAQRALYKQVASWYHPKSDWTQQPPPNDAPIDDRVTFYAFPGDQFPPE